MNNFSLPESGTYILRTQVVPTFLRYRSEDKENEVFSEPTMAEFEDFEIGVEGEGDALTGSYEISLKETLRDESYDATAEHEPRRVNPGPEKQGEGDETDQRRDGLHDGPAELPRNPSHER